MRKLFLIGLLGLVACTKPAAPQEDTPASAEAPAPVADAWPGKYEGDLMVRVVGTPGAHKVTLVAATPDGCTGDVGLAGGEPAKDGVSALQLSLKADAGTCTIDIYRQGNIVTVTESGACLTWHGGTCSFNGTATRLK